MNINDLHYAPAADVSEFLNTTNEVHPHQMLAALINAFDRIAIMERELAEAQSSIVTLSHGRLPCE